MTTHAHTSPIDFEYRKRIFAAATVIILCTQFQIMQMTQGEPRTEKANWNDAEIEAMLNYLILHRSKLAGTMFKMSTFNEAAADIGTKNLKTQGPMKTGAHCKTKWNALKGTYNQINKYLQKSGVHWDPKLGANIQGTAAEEAWSDYISKQSNTGMKPFKHGWKYYTKMQQILMRTSAAHGPAAYNPAALAGPTTENEPVPGSSTSGADASTSADLRNVGKGMADGMDTTDNVSWEIPPLPRPVPVASTSVMGAPPISSSGNSGKCSHHDMVFDTAPPSVTTSYTPMSEMAMSGTPQASSNVPQAQSDLKKVKLSAKGRSLGGGVTATTKTRVMASNKTIKDAANTAALMNLQGTVNCLSDPITTSFTVTDESRISDERKRAMHHMQQEEGFSADDRLVLTHVFIRSPAVCGTYLDITIPELRQAFLHSVIAEAARVITL